MEPEYKPWDVVKLVNHTGRYRVYTSNSRGIYIFACLDADVIRISDEELVAEILESAPESNGA